jgi:hypothetical protein
VQVDTLKPTLKAPGTKRLKLDFDELLSSFAFKFNLRRYAKAIKNEVELAGMVEAHLRDGVAMVGRCRLTPSNPR